MLVLNIASFSVLSEDLKGHAMRGNRVVFLRP